MDAILGVVFFVFGAVMGSFLNVCIDRLPAKKSIVKPPSHCDGCGHKLNAPDLIPIVSYIALRGKCRYCGAHIPLSVPFAELLTGSLFVIFWFSYVWYDYGSLADLALALIYSCFFVIIFFIDIKHYLVLNKVIYPALIVALIAAGATQYSDILSPLIGGVIGGGAFFIIALIAPGSMGMGDVKLGAFIGLIVGYPLIWIGLLVSVIIGGIVATGLLASKKKGRKDFVPFAPFLIIGGVTTMLYGTQILDLLLGR